MRITKDTQCCISIAERPSNFGSILMNAGFESLSLDFFYKSFRVTTQGLPDAIKGIRAFGIRGCGVSMPHKISVLNLLERVDPIAQKIGAVNTIVNDGGVLCGYNTDFEGAKQALQTYDVAGKRVLVIGAGGAARAIAMALKQSDVRDITVTNRDMTKGEALAKEFDLECIPYTQRSAFRGDMLINATPIGMVPEESSMVVEEDQVLPYQAVMDVVIFPPATRLIQIARTLGKTVIPGVQMALYQAAAQFKLYTGKDAPLAVMKERMDQLLNTPL